MLSLRCTDAKRRRRLAAEAAAAAPLPWRPLTNNVGAAVLRGHIAQTQAANTGEARAAAPLSCCCAAERTTARLGRQQTQRRNVLLVLDGGGRDILWSI